MKVVRQEGVEGWRVAQERKVWEGWAGEVMGDSWVRVWGRVWVVGKRMGDMKGLGGAVSGTIFLKWAVGGVNTAN